MTTTHRVQGQLKCNNLETIREARLRWFGHVEKRDTRCIGQRMLKMELLGRRKRKGQKRMLHLLWQPLKRAAEKRRRRKRRN